MTENKPIIIDGVDVNRCKHFKNRTCIADYLLTDMDFSEAKCKLCKDCYFKQLARKTRECEQAEQKLEKVRQVCAKAKNVGENINDMYTAKLSGLYLKSRQILQIIDEVE